MSYLLDTNIFRELLEHLPKAGPFLRLWEHIAELIEQGEILSMDECMEELKLHYSKSEQDLKWLKDRKAMFLPCTCAESLTIRKLSRDPKFAETVHHKNLHTYRPSADGYLIAKALLLEAVIVTKEVYKPNSSRLPYLCEKYGIKCIDYNQFISEVSAGLY